MTFLCKAFGRAASNLNVDYWTKVLNDSIENLNLLLILASTRTAEVKGISAAGATPSSRRYTAIADAELLLKGPLASREWPLPSLPAGVSPALLSHVAIRFLGLNPLVLPIGLEQFPSFPHLRVEPSSIGPANCLSTGKAMQYNRVKTLLNKGIAIGLRMRSPLVLTECVPGGTTTALAVLTGLGLSVGELISGSIRKPPTHLKQTLVARGLKLAELGIHPSPISLLAAVGDPFQPIAVGLVLGARSSGQPVLLGGGSQMLAVLAIALSTIDVPLRDSFVREIAIGTTDWLADESLGLDSQKKGNSFKILIGLLEEFYNVSLLCLTSGIHFYNSSKKVLRDYELGYIKEGVGIGALTCLAKINGISSSEFLSECELAVDQLQNNLET